MSRTKAERIEAVLQAFHTLQQPALHDAADEWLRTNLTMAQVKALFALQQAEGMMVSGLADRLRIGLPAASIMVDKLVQMGLLERREDAQDRRRTLVDLTPRARQLLVRLWQGRREVLENLLVQLSDENFQALLQGLEALARVAVTLEPVAERK